MYNENLAMNHESVFLFFAINLGISSGETPSRYNSTALSMYLQSDMFKDACRTHFLTLTGTPAVFISVVVYVNNASQFCPLV